jgi:hypothetical protein
MIVKLHAEINGGQNGRKVKEKNYRRENVNKEEGEKKSNPITNIT